MKWQIIVSLSLLVAGIGAVALKSSHNPASQPAFPIVYRLEVRTNPPMRLHFVEIDLTDSRVKLRSCLGGPDPDGNGPWDTTIDTVRAIAGRANLDVAINANFFATRETLNLLGRKTPYFIGNWARLASYAICDGQVVSRERGIATLAVDPDNKPRIGMFRVDELAGAIHAISGSGIIVTEGKPNHPMADRVPRTIVGLNRDASRMYFLVIDGRREKFSVGMTSDEAADELIKLGCWTALNLDGGGSSTLALRDRATRELKLMNRPSDGHDLPIDLSFERAVGNVFGVEILEASKQ